MRKSRSKEEKLKLIENNKARGLSMSNWCADNGIEAYNKSYIMNILSIHNYYILNM